MSKKFFLVCLCISLSMGAFAQSDTLNRTDKYGKKYGYWKVYDNKVLSYEGRFFNGEPVGKMVHYYPNGKIKSISTYTLNSPKVPCVLYHENGVKSAEGLFINKKKDGKWVYYNTSGKVISEENYTNCKKDGAFRMYAPETGIILEEVQWKNGVREGTSFNNYTNGQLRLKVNYKNDKMDGAFENYYEDGKLWTKGNYKEDFRNGEWTTYTPSGKELIVLTLDKGKTVSMLLGFNTGSQWIKLNINAIAYFYQGPTDIVICLKNQKTFHIIDDHLVDIAKRAGAEYFTFVNENVLTSYTAMKKVIPTGNEDEEAKIILRPEPGFEVISDGDYYKLIKCLLNKEAPKEN